jgi:asparagine synthase (glutamine-hydrolysing)
MCGIAGIIGNGRHHGVCSRERLQAMTDSLRHRGPDGEGHFIAYSDQSAVALGSRRLAIIDPGPASDQPLHFLDRYVIVHNGEIYNAPAIRQELIKSGLSFCSVGDTEVIAAAYHKWGAECVHHLNGMFAFAIWDRETESLYAARDRFGEKPFHFHYDDAEGLFLFASEMKALWAAGINRKPLHQAFLHFLTLGITEHPEFPELTFYEGILRLPPAHYLIFHPDTKNLTIDRYWDLDKVTQRERTIDDSIDQFQDLFQSAVNLRLNADTKIGIALSGGVDSASIASRSKNRVFDTVSAVFPGFIKDESDMISGIAEQLGMASHIIQPHAAMLIENMHALVHHQEEPFASAGIMAQFAVHDLAARQGLRVMLDGQGADELLGGYDRYAQWHLLEVVREKGWASASKEANTLVENSFLPSWGWRNRLAAKFPGLTAAWLERKARQLHDRLDEIDDQFREGNDGAGFIRKPLVERLNDILYTDCLTGPLQTLLRYADRNAMAHGIETRFPFLDHRLAEFIFSLPSHLKFRNGYNKWILRESHRSQIIEKVIWRTGKTGFEPPQFEWMSDERVVKEIKLAHEKLVDLRLLNPKVMRREIMPCHAYARDNRDWRYWIAASFL